MKPTTLTVVAILIAVPAMGSEVPQGVGAQERSVRHHALYVEMLGSAGLASLNYEYRLTAPVAFRVGVGYLYQQPWLSCLLGCSYPPVDEFLTVPLMASYLVGSVAHQLELGAGITAGLNVRTDGATGGNVVGGSAVVGYRYFDEETKTVLRLGLTPGLIPTSVDRLGYFVTLVGASFGRAL